jgi:hypothetical protein
VPSAAPRAGGRNDRATSRRRSRVWDRAKPSVCASPRSECYRTRLPGSDRASGYSAAVGLQIPGPSKMDPIETGFASPLTLDFCRRRTHCTDEFIYDPASRGCGAVRSSPAGARRAGCRRLSSRPWRVMISSKAFGSIKFWYAGPQRGRDGSSRAPIPCAQVPHGNATGDCELRRSP